MHYLLCFTIVCVKTFSILRHVISFVGFCYCCCLFMLCGVKDLFVNTSLISDTTAATTTAFDFCLTCALLWSYCRLGKIKLLGIAGLIWQFLQARSKQPVYVAATV